jgi:single-strand DNA-binding protein
MVLIGRLVKDVVVTQLKDERRVVNFTVAMNDSYKPKNSDKVVSVATYINCSYWISPKIAEWLTKGSLVEVAGRLSVSAYTDMQGEAKGTLNCHVDVIKIHTKRKNTSVQPQAVQKVEIAEDLPF